MIGRLILNAIETLRNPVPYPKMPKPPEPPQRAPEQIIFLAITQLTYGARLLTKGNPRISIHIEIDDASQAIDIAAGLSRYMDPEIAFAFNNARLSGVDISWAVKK